MNRIFLLNVILNNLISIIFRFVICTGQPIKQDGRIVKEIRLADDFTWLTNGDVFEKIKNLGQGFLALDITPQDKVLLFADTRIEWLLASFSLLYQNIPIVTLFSNLGESLFSCFFCFLTIT